jgi:hypothetical protein
LHAAVLNQHGAKPRIEEFEDPSGGDDALDVPAISLRLSRRRRRVRSTSRSIFGGASLPSRRCAQPVGDLEVEYEAVPLDDIATAWERQQQPSGGPKVVLVP